MTPNDITKIRGRMDQRSFAAILGVTPGAVSLWETGQRSPTSAARVLLELLWRKPEIRRALRDIEVDHVREKLSS